MRLRHQRALARSLAASASAAASDRRRHVDGVGRGLGFFIRSNRVETDSTLGLRRSSGLESNRTKDHQHQRHHARAPPRPAPRAGGARCMKSSSGARLAKPTSSSSPGGFSSISSAGSMVMRQQEGHDHADAGDLAQFRHAGIGGGQEGEEAGRRRGRRQRQRHAHAAPGAGTAPWPDRRCWMTLVAIAHRELDAEIHAQSDEQRDEGDGDDVEHAHRQQAQRHGDGQAHEQRRPGWRRSA